MNGPTRSPVSSAVTVVIPVFNEERAIRQEIEGIRATLTESGFTHEIIVVDDGSADASGERAAKAGARVLRHVVNRGYGASLKTGIGAARYDTIAITDADGTYPANRLPDLLSQLDDADMVVGSRTGSNVQIPLIRRPAKWVLNWLANRVAGRRIPDLNSGLRVFRKDIAEQYLSILSNRFSFTTTITLAFLADDYRIVYVPIDYYRRIGRSKITPKHFMEFMILVLRMAMLFQPLRVFLPMGFLFGGIGTIKAVADVVFFVQRTPTPGVSMLNQPVLSSSAILLMLTGLQLLLVGLVADGVIRRIAHHAGSYASSRAVLAVEVDVNEPETRKAGRPSG